MRLLLRLYDVDSGTVLVNGADVRTLTQHSLRKHIGVVAQDTVRSFQPSQQSVFSEGILVFRIS